jgi:hypothetical protein
VTEDVVPGTSALTEDGLAPQIIVVSGGPDTEEMAAVTAVLSGVLEELAAEQGRRQSHGPSAWERSQHGLRTPLNPGTGSWQAFGS